MSQRPLRSALTELKHNRHIQLTLSTIALLTFLTFFVFQDSIFRNRPTRSSEDNTIEFPPFIASPSITPSPEPTLPPDECIPEIGPVEIVQPKEGQIVRDNPLKIQILYRQGKYCSAVWQYRFNDEDWSSPFHENIEIYNLESGEKRLQLRVLGAASSDEKIIERNFIYKNNSVLPTPTDEPFPTSLPTMPPVRE